ncbi:nucleoside phosphorylase [Flavobacteriales bacterium]|nr:nucleoside phosphorylase [Flavobacteriales bacterium]
MKPKRNISKKVYHLNLLPEHISKDIFLVGDQGRVSEISKRFDRIDYQISNREFITHTGYIGKKKISVISTGIGTDNIDIVINELDALINTNLQTGEKLESLTKLNLVRLGTSGTIHKEIDLNSIVVSSYGLGLDNLMYFYANNDFDKEIQTAINKQIKWPSKLSKPYVYSASQDLLNKFDDFVNGITITAPGFYAPQARKVRIPYAYKNLNKEMINFNYKGIKIINYEMETSALYGLGKLMGHNCLTLCTILANRATNKRSNNYKNAIDNLINKTLERLV